MNKQAILHIQDSNYAYPKSVDKFVVRLRVARNDNIQRVIIEYGCKYTFYDVRFEKEMKIKYNDELYSYYEVELKLDDPRLAYVFRIYDSSNEVYYYFEEGLSKEFDYKKSFYNYFQYAHINEVDIVEEVEWFKNAVFYQIFVDRFNRGKNKKDFSYITMQKEDTPTPQSFYGGDLEGIYDKIEYLHSIGINAIYLTPIFKSISNHKYDIIDYEKIDEHFGNDEIFINLVKKAHEYGIKIVIDVVFNHCSNQHNYFNDDKYYDYFRRTKDGYMTFADCEYMPEWNTNNPKVVDYLIDITKNWIRKYDIDGLRLDVADELPHEFWRRFRKEVRKEKSDCIIVGEDWHDSYTYLLGDQFDSTMNYAFTKACVDYLATQKLDEKGLSDRLNMLLMRYREQNNKQCFNLLDSHDKERFYTQVGKSKNKLLAGLNLLMFYQGVPCIYYATEQMMEGEGDPYCRRAFDWDKKPEQEILDILKLRKEKVLVDGDIQIYEKDGKLYVKRTLDDKTKTLVISKNGEEFNVE